MKRKRLLAALGLVCTTLWLVLATVNLAEARAGGGRSMGSRGSHSSSAPRPAFNPQPSRPQPMTPPAAVNPGMTTPRPAPSLPSPAPATSGWGSFARGMAGGFVGGMIGNMLFGGSGHAGPAAMGPGGAPAAGGSGCTSVGLFDIILIGGLLYLGYRMLNRRQEAYQMGGLGGTETSNVFPTATPETIPLPAYDVQGELETIKRSDPSFNETAFTEMAQDVFFKVQGAWMRQEATLLKDLATTELFGLLDKDLQDLKAKGQINKLENIAVRQVAVSEAWQEQGQDYITVGFLANLLDYTVDANTNLVLAGSDKDPVKFEEYWTFTRSTGSGPWKLSAITQPEG